MPLLSPPLLRAILTALMLTLAAATPGLAQSLIPGKSAPAQGGEDQPVLLKADEITYDESLSLVTARGHVEISQGDRVLHADTVTYNEKTKVMTASGNVALMESTGEVYFSDYAEFTNEMRDGVVAALRVLLSDNSRMAATGGKRINGTITELHKGVFSPCDLCKKDPTRPPIWQIKAVRIVHDSEAKEIEYRDAILELAGIPVFYTPYLSQPDPTVHRRSGFLFPSFGHETGLGSVLKTPYYWDLGPDRDVTLSPYFTTDQGPVLETEYRQRFTNGSLFFDGSLTYGDASGSAVPTGQQEYRGHIIGNGRFDIDDTFRTGFDLARATDATYMRRYGFGGGGNGIGSANSTNELTTTAYVEGFSERNYGRISGYTFQDIQAGANSSQTPLILPLAQYNYVGSPDKLGGHAGLDANVLDLTRETGADSRRISLRPSWQLPYTSPAGYVTTWTTSLQADAYNVNNVPLGNGSSFSGTTGRLFPQTAVDWRFPFSKHHDSFTEVLEPIAGAVAAPNGSNPSRIPNEDSVAVDFDDTNLFSMSRYPGVDRVEGGERVIYGLRWGAYGQTGGSTEAFVGQSYAFQKHPDFGIGSGLENNASDVVGRLRVSPNDYFDFLYRFRTDASDGTFRRNEVGVSVGPPRFRLTNDYVFLRAQPDQAAQLSQLANGNREQMSTTLSVGLSDHWSIGAQTVNDLTSATGGPLFNSGTVTYTDECLTVTTTLFRRYTSDRDLTPATGIFVNFIFKYLGDFGSGSRPNG
jgi:LPS-assembly protein